MYLSSKAGTDCASCMFVSMNIGLSFNSQSPLRFICSVLTQALNQVRFPPSRLQTIFLQLFSQHFHHCVLLPVAMSSQQPSLVSEVDDIHTINSTICGCSSAPSVCPRAGRHIISAAGMVLTAVCGERGAVSQGSNSGLGTAIMALI